MGMKRNHVFMLALLVLIVCPAIAQKKSNFVLQPQLSFLNGNHTVDGAISFLSGVEFNQWQIVGVAGFDYYQKRSVPLYAEAKRFFGQKKNKPFVYGGAGLNFAWPTDAQRHYIYDWTWGGSITSEASYQNGRYLEAGIGCFLQNKRGKGFSLSLGYSSKTQGENWEEDVWDPSTSTNIKTPRSVKFEFNRIDIKLGLRIF